MPTPRPASVRDVENLILEAQEQEQGGLVLPFALIDTTWKRAVGSTRYLDYRPLHRGIEIGWTWIGSDFQRTASTPRPSCCCWATPSRSWA
jgi:RimJ/RimL family protein N-acetyltransferase